MKKLITAAIVAITVLCTGSAAHADSIVPGDENLVLTLLNATRTALGRHAVSHNDYLMGMARRQAQRMADRGDIYHNPNLGGEIGASGMNWRKVGENVGMGPNVSLIEDAFLKSPHHYENIIDPAYNIAAIGAIKGDDGKMYVVQVFANVVSAAAAPAPAASVAPKPAAAAAPAAAPVTHAPVTAAPATPKPRPVVHRSADPNAVVGGFVTALDLSAPASHGAQNGAFGAISTLLRHVGSAVASLV